MRVLIIGGLGNISTPISRRLMAQGHELVLFKRTPQLPDWLPGVQVVTGDRKDTASFEDRLGALPPWDCVIDMLCFDPLEAESDIRVFRGRTKQLIFCSTVDVYPKAPSHYPVTEQSELGARPSFGYGFKKVACERLFWEAHERGDFALTVLRPAFTYNETWSPGIHSFGGGTYHLDRLIKGKPVILHGDGTSIWVATYREDTARAFVGAVGNPLAMGQAYTVSGDEWMTQEHIWRTIARGLGAPEPDFVRIPTEVLGAIAPRQAEWCVENFQHNNIFDNSKAKRHLGFRYTVTFEEGVCKCLDYLRPRGLIEDSAKHPFYDRVIEAWRQHRAALAEEFRLRPLDPA